MAFFVCNLWSFFSQCPLMFTWKILINGNVMLTSNLISHNFSDASWRKFLFPPSSFRVFDPLKLFVFFHYGQKSRNRNQKLLEYGLVPLSIIVSINNSCSQIRTALFSSRHADSNVAGRRMSTFANEKTQLRATDKLYSARIINIILLNKFSLVHSLIRNGMAMKAKCILP